MSILDDLIIDPWDPHRTTNGRDLTIGPFTTETQAEEHFDQMIERTGWFTIRKQVRGRYVMARPHQEQKDPRIDRILIPTDDAIGMGWTIGPVGVEIKRSGEKIGRPISQALDYSRALWSIGGRVPGTWVALQWVFVFPVAVQFGPVGSIMSQQRIGSISSGSDGHMSMMSGQQSIAHWSSTGNNFINTETMRHGRKVGSR